MRHALFALCVVLCALSFSACEPSQEAPQVTLEVWASEESLEPVFTNLGYEVTITHAELSLRDLRFMVAGEAHLAFGEHLLSLLFSKARAHPGHLQGGEITGALMGEALAVWGTEDALEDTQPTQPLGSAQLITGRYSSAEFTFSDQLPSAHTALLEGVASREGREVRFSALINAPEDRALTGVPFEATISTTPNARLLLELSASAFEGEHTLFDGLDFEALDALEGERDEEAGGGADGALTLSPAHPTTEAGYFILRRALMTHDFYRVRYEPQPSSINQAQSDEL
jgi:hypothetical protein